MRIVDLLIGLVLLTFLSPNLMADTNNFRLAAQYDWRSKRGFYLNLENSSEGDAPCGIGTLRLVLGVADGDNWRFISASRSWEFDTKYLSKAVVGPNGAELWLDGTLIDKSKGGFSPAEGVVQANHVPHWAAAPTGYLALQTSLKLSTSSGKHFETRFPDQPLTLFAPRAAEYIEWTLAAGETLTIEATFCIRRYPDLHELGPFVDRYGQYRYSEWQGKVNTDEDLKEAWHEEKDRLKAWGQPEGYDRFGGHTLAGWTEKPTGFYRVARRDGFWWLISPEGNPCFYLGVCTAPALNWEMTPVTGREFVFGWLPGKGPPYSSAWRKNVWGVNDGTEYAAFHTCNIIRKYGDEWDRESIQITARRFKSWGFSGIGKWGRMDGLPYLPVLGRRGVPNVARHPDIFDAEVRAKFRSVVRSQIEPHKDDPFVVGWSLGNEYDEIITKGEIEDILKRPARTAAKSALVDFALENMYESNMARMAASWETGGQRPEEFYTARLRPPADDIEKLRRFYAERYYDFIYRTVKELDPNHLYFSFWVTPGWWENEEDWRLIARCCDVIGYDLYSYEFADERLLRLMQEARKPVFCGEFSFPAWYEGKRGFGMYRVSAKSDAESGSCYKRWLKSASGNPYCVGACWFEYRDQHVTGRGPGRGERLVYGENYAFGVVDITDKPKWDLVAHMREANLAAVSWRLNAMARRGDGRTKQSGSKTP